jgi:hypothetical protein
MQQSTDPRNNPSNSPQPSVSERKLAANRANAQRSTGPRTPEGKSRAAMNALRHGILARSAFNAKIDGEERRAEFDELVLGLAQEYQPRTTTEIMTVQQLAGCYWKLAKIWNYETRQALHASNIDDPSDIAEPAIYGSDHGRKKILEAERKQFAEAGLGGKVCMPFSATIVTILRYQGAINSMMSRCLTILERRRKERMKSDEPFEEIDYLNEATAPQEASTESAAASAGTGDLQKRTQKDAKDAAPDASSSAQPHAPKPSGAAEPPQSA